MILCIEIPIIGKIDQLMGSSHHILQLVSEHAAVPQSTLPDILRSHIGCGLLLEGGYPCRKLIALGNDIPVLLTGVGGLDAHQHQIRLTLVRLFGELLQRPEIVLLHIGVYGTYHHRLLRIDPAHIHQISGGQRDGGEGISSAGLYGDSNLLPQLIVETWVLLVAMVTVASGSTCRI